MAKTRLAAAHPKIVKAFSASGTRIFRQRDLSGFFDEHRAAWRLPDSLSFRQFVRHLTDHTELRKVELKLPHRPETRYVWGDVPTVLLALALKPHSYLTHFSALWLHELTKQVPKTLYVNVEQRPQVSNPGSLTQEAIDRAFKNQQRMTSNVAEYEGTRLVFLNGKFTGQLGVIDHRLPTGESVRVTDLERTLIDIAVRPAYSGGVANVAASYSAAAGRASVGRVATLLETMDYVYPYEQVIGFYLERAGVKEADLRPFRRRPFAFNFYLAHGMKDVELVDRWRLWVPRGF